MRIIKSTRVSRRPKVYGVQFTVISPILGDMDIIPIHKDILMWSIKVKYMQDK